MNWETHFNYISKNDYHKVLILLLMLVISMYKGHDRRVLLILHYIAKSHTNEVLHKFLALFDKNGIFAYLTLPLTF